MALVVTMDLVLEAVLDLRGQEASVQPRSAREEVIDLAARGEYAAADHILAEELRNDPANFALLYNRALVNFFWKRDEESLRLLRSVAAGDREDPNYQALLSSVLTGLGRYREALPASREALRLAPSDAENWLRLGALYLHLKMGGHATEVYEKGQTLFPERPEFLLGLGVIQEMQAKFEATIPTYEEVVRKFPRYLGGYLFLAGAYLKASRTAEAARAATQALALDSRSALAECFLAEAAWKTPGQEKEATARIQKALQLDPTLPEALVLAAKIELKRDDPQQAVYYLKKATAEQPRMASAFYVLGQTYRRLSQTRDAEAALREFKRLQRSESLGNPLVASLLAARQ